MGQHSMSQHNMPGDKGLALERKFGFLLSYITSVVFGCSLFCGRTYSAVLLLEDTNLQLVSGDAQK